jgi:Flp pilus assembly protein TadD
VFEALSGLYERGGRLSEAVTVLTQALRKRPKDEQLLYALGTVYERKGDTQKSLEKMRSVLDVNPENANAMNFIGYLLADTGKDFEEAEKLLIRALELKPENASFLDSLGWIYFRRGDVDKALETLTHANTVSPNEPTINEHLGDVWARAQKKKDAADAYQRALNALKEDPDLAENKGQRGGIEKKLKALEDK